ncbi:MAG: family 16 glycosylhydrolase [Bacteroidota bacterium]
MRSKLCLFLCLALIPVHLSAQNWQVVWHDEFDGEGLDLEKWSYQKGTGLEYGLTDWGNNELQYYRERNVTVSGGMLHITAKKENYAGKAYTSGRIRTVSKGDWTYCRIEFRAKMPLGKGLWAAVWMLPTDEEYGGWAASGELDIMEYLGHEPNIVHGTLHFGDAWPANKYKGTNYTLSEGDFYSEFHDFALEWVEGEIRWYVDGHRYQTQGAGDWWSAGEPFPAPFDKQFHLLVNLAVGGNWPGSPDGSTSFPQELVLDYIRVFQDLEVGIAQDESDSQTGFGLQQNYPNPFDNSTTISYSLQEAAHVTLEVFDATARLVDTVVDESLDAGSYEVNFDGSELAPGLYTCKLHTGDNKQSMHMILTRK